MGRYIAIAKKAGYYSIVFLKWTILSLISGCVVGGVSVLFSKAMTYATDFRTAHSVIIYFLPIAGLFIVFCYQMLKLKEDKGTNLVLTSLNAHDSVPVKVAPLIIVSTVLTHLFGGSAGREGAALQLGGSLGNALGRLIRLDENDKKIMIMSGMSAAFAALFGTPMAAALFPIEVATVGVMYYSALLPCIVASLVAVHFAANMGISPESFTILEVPKESVITYGKIGILAIGCALVSILLCVVLHDSAKIFKKLIKNPYIRVVIGAAIIIALTTILRTRDYLGAGIPVIEHAMEGHVEPAAFIWKMVFTAITLAVGFKGGEIVPTFFIGATFGCVMGHMLDISPSLCAAIGMSAMFCGVTNSPVTSLLISFELFGFEGVPYFMIAIAISYVLSGYIGLYREQIIAYSKYKVKTHVTEEKTEEEQES